MRVGKAIKRVEDLLLFLAGDVAEYHLYMEELAEADRLDAPKTMDEALSGKNNTRAISQSRTDRSIACKE